MRRGRGSALALAAVTLAALVWWVATPATTAHAQVDISIDPAMVKGAPTAVVTIVEFSDYQ
ncbi:MAG: hypothetical protein HYU41_09230 [Candidatus Rokubacteria bacterium]|nr:hypothetical protein [Candidatus Rokubacteria bacterium]